MPGLFGNLSLAAQALQAHQVAIQVTGRNIANVNNPEYARQRVLMGDRNSVATPTGPEGTGVEVLQVQQLRDALLDKQVVRQISDTEGLKAQGLALADAQLALGDKIDNASTPTSVTDTSASTNGISGALDDFFNAAEALASSPADLPARDAMIQSAQIFADRINNADSRLSTLQSDLETQLQSDANKVNSLLQDIANLNAQIRGADPVQTGNAADLIDKRQKDLEDLAGLAKFDISIPTEEPNMVEISFGGQLLVTYGKTPKGPNPFSYVPASTTPATGAGVYPLSTATGFVKGKLMVGGVDSTQALTGTANGLNGGAMAGRYDAITGHDIYSYDPVQRRDVVSGTTFSISALRDQLNTFAKQIATAVNAKYTPATPTGSSAGFPAGTGNFFVTTPSSGLLQVDSTITAANLATGPLSDPTTGGTNTNAGDNTYIRNIANLRKTSFSTSVASAAISPGVTADRLTGRLSDYIRTTVGTLAQSIKAVTTRSDEANVIDAAIKAQRDSVSGVSLDEETTNMMQYQRAYQANAKVISVIDDMLNSLINSMVR